MRRVSSSRFRVEARVPTDAITTSRDRRARRPHVEHRLGADVDLDAAQDLQALDPAAHFSIVARREPSVAQTPRVIAHGEVDAAEPLGRRGHLVETRVHPTRSCASCRSPPRIQSMSFGSFPSLLSVILSSGAVEAQPRNSYSSSSVAAVKTSSVSVFFTVLELQSPRVTASSRMATLCAFERPQVLQQVPVALRRDERGGRSGGVGATRPARPPPTTSAHPGCATKWAVKRADRGDDVEVAHRRTGARCPLRETEPRPDGSGASSTASSTAGSTRPRLSARSPSSVSQRKRQLLLRFGPILPPRAGLAR